MRRSSAGLKNTPSILPKRSALRAILPPLMRTSRLVSKMSASMVTEPKRVRAAAKMWACSSPSRMSCLSFLVRKEVPVHR